MPLLIGLLVSCMLALTGCVKHPPCNRSDIGRTADGKMTVTDQCWDRMLGDLDACYPTK